MSKARTGDGRSDSRKPLMKECLFEDGKGGVNWKDTSQNFPMHEENERKIRRENDPRR